MNRLKGTTMTINHPINPAPIDTWSTDTDGLHERFDVLGFAAGLVIVERKADGRTGTLEFNGNPRVYHSWRED